MKKNRIYVIWIIFLTILIGFSIYNYKHPIKKAEKIISSGKIVTFDEELEYSENSEYITNYIMELETKNDGNITIKINKDETNKYKVGDKINYYEEKGEYKVTKEKRNDYNTNIIWIILPILEFIGIIICILKMKKMQK